MKRHNFGVQRLLSTVLLALGASLALADDTTGSEGGSSSYVQVGLIAHWDGIDNTLADGVRSHTADATIWCDLVGENDVTLPSYVTVEEKSMLSEKDADKDKSEPVTLSKLTCMTGTTEYYVKYSMIGDAAFTVEIVSERGTWTSSNPDTLQNVFSTPRGSVGYRKIRDDGFYVYWPPEKNKRTVWHLQNGKAAQAIHAFSVDFGITSKYNRIFMDGEDVTADTTDGGYTAKDWDGKFTLFGNKHTNIRVYAIRVYRRTLSTYERMRNYQIDRVRFFGAEKPSFVAKDLPDAIWTGNDLTPDPVVVNPLTEEPLVKGTDYTLSYENNVNPGTATVTVTGIGNWQGSSLVCPFEIATRESYLELRYIESSGTQYIDTGYLPHPNTKMEATVMFDGNMSRTASASYGSWFGCQEDSSSFAINFGGAANEDDKLHPWFDKRHGFGGKDNVFSIAGLRNSKQKFTIDASTGKGTYGTTAFTATAKTTTHTVNTLCLFGRRALDGVGEPFTYCKMRVFGWKIWDGETLVRDFVPCRASGGRIGLYDRVNDRFYENAGFDTFAYETKPGFMLIVR